MENKNKEKNKPREDRISIHRGFYSTLLISGFLVIFVAGGVYVAYLFIHNSRVSNLADVHITDKLELAKRKAFGQAYDNPDNGIYDWVRYRDEGNGIDIKYPRDWEMIISRDSIFEIRKYNARQNSRDSLAAILLIEAYDNKDMLSLREFATYDSGIADDYFEEIILSGRNIIRLAKMTEETGLVSSCMFWERDDKVYHLKGIYFNEKTEALESVLNKIISELEIT